MSSDTDTRVRRRSGAQTRRLAQRVALELFTRYGYERTSLRQIAEELGINKASLYYHFASKEAILQSLMDERGSEAEQLIEWLHQQPRTADLLEQAVLRWVLSFSADKLRAIRFMAANPLVIRDLAKGGGDRVGSLLSALIDDLSELLPERTDENVLLLRMSVLSINSAAQAVAPGVDNAVIVNAAQRAARALLREISRAS